MNTHRPGFTLIELILATATAAVLALALYAALGVAMKARGAAMRAVDLDREASLVADFVVRDLEATLPPSGILAGPFIGEASFISFHAFPSVTGEVAADLPQRVELELRRDVIPPALVRRRQPNLLAPSETVPDEEILCRGVTEFALRYYDGTSWVETWDSSIAESTTADILPQAVEVTLVIEREETDGEPARRASVVRLVRMPLGSDVPPIDEDTETEATS